MLASYPEHMFSQGEAQGRNYVSLYLNDPIFGIEKAQT